MTPQQIERNRAFIRDLRANEKKAKNMMRDDEGGRCCLCVAYDTAQSLGAALPPLATQMPPSEIKDFYGWQHRDPDLKAGGRKYGASFFNDGYCVPELTHAQIADAFEATFPEIKPPTDACP